MPETPLVGVKGLLIVASLVEFDGLLNDFYGVPGFIRVGFGAGTVPGTRESLARTWWRCRGDVGIWLWPSGSLSEGYVCGSGLEGWKSIKCH